VTNIKKKAEGKNKKEEKQPKRTRHLRRETSKDHESGEKIRKTSAPTRKKKKKQTQKIDQVSHKQDAKGCTAYPEEELRKTNKKVKYFGKD